MFSLQQASPVEPVWVKGFRFGNWPQHWRSFLVTEFKVERLKNCAVQMDLEFKNSFQKYGPGTDRPGRSQFVPGTAQNEGKIFQVGTRRN